MSHAHAVVWLDHRTARVISFSLHTSEVTEIHSTSEEGRLHRKSGIPGSGHAADDLAFFDQVVGVLAEIPGVLITGPGTAKKAFELYVNDRHPILARRIVGVETLDHPSNGELLAHGRKSFARIDALGLH